MAELEEETHTDPECRKAWKRIGDFVAEGLLGAEHTALRAHLDACEECMEHYRAAVDATSRVGRQKRDRAELEAALERQERMHEAGYDVPAPARHTNWNRLRTIVYPAFFIFIMVLVTRGPRFSDDAGVVLLAGEAVAADSGLGADRLTIGRGDWCATGPASRVKLDVHEVTVMLGADTRVSLESLDPARLRLAAGSVDPQGTCTISTALGVVDFKQATGTLALHDWGLEIRMNTGFAIFTGASGEERIDAGESFRVDL